MNEDYFESLVAGTSVDNSDSGAEVARKFNDNFDKVDQRFIAIESELEGLDDLLGSGVFE